MHCVALFYVSELGAEGEVCLDFQFQGCVVVSDFGDYGLLWAAAQTRFLKAEWVLFYSLELKTVRYLSLPKYPKHQSVLKKLEQKQKRCFLTCNNLTMSGAGCCSNNQLRHCGLLPSPWMQ